MSVRCSHLSVSIGDGFGTPSPQMSKFFVLEDMVVFWQALLSWGQMDSECLGCSHSLQNALTLPDPSGGSWLLGLGSVCMYSCY